MKQTLLQKAKKIKVNTKTSTLLETATPEQIELALAWCEDEITLAQFTKALWGENTSGAVGGRALYTIACWLKAAIRRGILVRK